jgi:hypothetical protein
MKKNYTLFKLGIFASTVLLTSYSSGPGGSDQQVSGAPGEGTCVNCHNGSALNSGSGSIAVAINGGSTSYIPGNSYTIDVTGTGSVANKYGFQMVALKTSDDSNVGSFTPDTGTKLSALSAKSYVEHSTTSTTGTWSFTWRAPLSDVGDVKFYIAGNSAESPGGTGGDKIYTSSLTLTPNSGAATNEVSRNKTSLSPNPSTGQTTLSFSLKTTAFLSINVVDLSGSTVVQLSDNSLFSSGDQNVKISTESLNPGIYFVRIQGEGHNELIKLVKN